MSKKKILLLGGGYVLSKFLKNFQQDFDLLISSRKAEKVRSFQHSGYSAMQLDLLNKSSIEECFNNHSDLQIIIDSVPPQENHSGINNLLSCLPESIERVIFFSTSGVYGATSGEIVSESTNCQPLNPKSLLRLEAENLYSKFSEQLEFQFSALRIPAISGPGRNPLQYLSTGNYPYVDQGRRWMNRIHVDDLNKIIRRIILDGFNFDLLNVSTGEKLQVKDLVEFYKQNISKDLQLKNMSYAELKEKGYYTLMTNQLVSNQKLLELFKEDPVDYKSFQWMLDDYNLKDGS